MIYDIDMIGDGSILLELSGPGIIDKRRIRINALHLHDNNGMHDEHLAPGKGSVEFVDVLKKVNSCCTYVLEMKAIPDII